MNISKKLKENKYYLEFFVFFTTLTVFLFVFFIMFYFQGEDFMIRSDSPGYLQLAKNLINYKVFSQSAQPPFIADSFRTPLYPFFLSVFLIFTGRLWAIGAFQCLLAAVGALFVFKIGDFLRSKIVGFAAAFLFGFDFYHLVSMGTIHTESLFVPLIIVSVYYFLLFLKNQKNKELIISVLFLGLAALTRPIALYLGIIFIFICIFIHFFIWKKKLALFSLKPVIIFLFLLILIILPWLIRKQIIFDKFNLSSVKDYNFYFWNLSAIHARNFGIPKNEVQSFLEEKIKQEFPGIKDEEISSFKLGDYYKKESANALKGNYIKYSKEHILGSAYFLVANYYRKAAYVFTGVSEENIPLRHSFQDVPGLMKRGGFPIIMAVFGFLISGIYLIFLIINIFYLFKIKNPEYEIVLYGVIGYFALITGPLASGSYRLPVLPFIVILALLGFFRALKSVKNKKLWAVLKN